MPYQLSCVRDALELLPEGCAFAGNVGGTSWQGQKTVFTDEVHGSDAVAPEGADAEVHTLASSQDHSTAGTFEKIKWKRIARQLLEQVTCISLALSRKLRAVMHVI